MYFNNYNVAISNNGVVFELTAYLKHLNAKGCSPKTIDNNKVQLKKFYDFLENTGMSIKEIVYLEKPALFHEKYVNYLREKNLDIKSQSINVNLACCERYFHFLYVNKYVDKELSGETKSIATRTDFIEYTKGRYDMKMSYAFARIKTYKKLYVAYDFNLTEELLKIVLGDQLVFPKLKTNSKTFLNDYIKFRNAVIIQLMGTYGMRIGEVLGIHLSDLQVLNNNIILVNRRLDNVNGAIAKIRSRDVNVNQRMIDNIYELADISYDYFKSDYLFLNKEGKPIFPKTIQNMFMKYKSVLIKKGLISDSDPITPHRLRHECLSGIYRKTHDLAIVKEIAGHKNLSSTEIYVHLTNKEKLENVEKYALINSGIVEEEKDLLLEDLGDEQ